MAAAVDVPAAVGMMHYMAGWASKISGELIEPMSAPRGVFHSYVRREPVGVAAQIVPWNFPLLMAVLKISPALAAGCTLILKPAEQTSLTALKLADLVAEAGFPAGVINVITGLGETAGDRLVKHPDVDKVAFTGSTEVGKIINRNATDSLKRVTLELGGKSPVVVLPDVDVAATAPGAAGAIFFNAGQVCIAGSRLYAHRSIFDKLIEGVADAAAFWAPRPSLDPEGHMGPLVSSEQFDRVDGLYRRGQEGRRERRGGRRRAELRRRLLRQPDRAGRRAARHERGAGGDLRPRRGGAALRRSRRGRQVGQRHLLRAGRGHLDARSGGDAQARRQDQGGHRLGNCHAVIDPALPFGGFKQSGLGREQGRQGVEMYTELKSVIIQL